ARTASGEPTIASCWHARAFSNVEASVRESVSMKGAASSGPETPAGGAATALHARERAAVTRPAAARERIAFMRGEGEIQFGAGLMSDSDSPWLAHGAIAHAIGFGIREGLGRRIVFEGAAEHP